MRISTGVLGLAAIGLFVGSLVLFSFLNPDFDIINDYISKLGAQGQPNATWWNLIGFVGVGLIFSIFGWNHGQLNRDRVAGICLTLSGIGFAMGAIPTDLADADARLSKTHFVAICLALATWYFALARTGHVGSTDPLQKPAANVAGALAVLPMIGLGIGLCSAPVSHRLTLAVVFGWVLFTSLRLLFSKEKATA